MFTVRDRHDPPRDVSRRREWRTRFPGSDAPDRSIDHRRVPNLRVFLARHGTTLPVTDAASDYLPGELVTWRLPSGPHIGIISDRRSRDGVPLVLHNVGAGAMEEDFLFSFPITGRYRYPRPDASEAGR